MSGSWCTAMSDGALISGRFRATSRMTSTATIRRQSGTTTDPDGFQVPGWQTLFTALPMRLGGADSGGAGTRSTTSGGVDVQLAIRVASFPHDTTGLRDNDIVQVTSGENAGVFVRIVEAAWQDQSTARRVPVIETTQPAGWV